MWKRADVCPYCILKLAPTDGSGPDTAQQAQPAIAAIQGALRIEALWLPAFIEKGHEGEAEALHAMRNSFLSVLQQQSGG
jgi:hypothetical protein